MSQTLKKYVHQSDQIHLSANAWAYLLLVMCTVFYHVPYLGTWLILKVLGGFPGGAGVESLPADAGDTGSSPGLGRSHMPRSN